MIHGETDLAAHHLFVSKPVQTWSTDWEALMKMKEGKTWAWDGQGGRVSSKDLHRQVKWFWKKKKKVVIEILLKHIHLPSLSPLPLSSLVSSIHRQDLRKERGEEIDTSSVCHFTLNGSRHGQSNPDSPGERDWCSVRETFIKYSHTAIAIWLHLK